ncbi:hypothetical protein GCM10010168_20660 [Actinoplanes ianthinogenes]|uniref:HTH araC/xylS-type domain-containing protein n=1 Tax=Actinoplanes ianthinogenes TaxID=122358 RepID=A0ABN6CRF3_9ACTN|nr:helix-turn-helix transcriptional regulator [Actinoplanes ianthinogenes]BCJ47707.1 hypothetical protein Aiant_83640 [Actinoplanes ianthinogenes]GGR03615.1 hypothetical protein GCM10010168_20660 [Actinoplanes ianthinogenes]
MAAVYAETFDSQDLDQVEEFVSRIYSKMRIGAVGEHTRARINRRALSPEVGFDDLDYSFDIGYAAEPPDLLIICDVVSETIRSGDDTFGPGDQFLISRPGLPYAGMAHSPRLRFTLLDPALLARTATPDGRPVRLLGHRPISGRAQSQLRRAIAYVRDEVMAAPCGPMTPLMISTASQLLAASVLHTYPNTAMGETTRIDRRDAGRGALRRAVAFVENNPELDLTVADIARAAGVTPRALQLIFRRELDTTPMAHLRRIRLDRAHHQLRAATAGGRETVAAIAVRWGFTPARFARQYLAAYGQLPSRTLRE